MPRLTPAADRTLPVRPSVHLQVDRLEDRTQTGDLLLSGLLLQGLFPADPAPRPPQGSDPAFARWLPAAGVTAAPPRAGGTDAAGVVPTPRPAAAARPVAPVPVATVPQVSEVNFSPLSTGAVGVSGVTAGNGVSVAGSRQQSAPLVTAGTPVSPAFTRGATPPGELAGPGNMAAPVLNRITVQNNPTGETVGRPIKPATPTPPVVAPPRPPATPKLVQPPPMDFTRTEILAGIRGQNPIGYLRSLSMSDAGGPIDAARSRVINVSQDGVSLVLVGLRNGADPQAVATRIGRLPRVAWAEPNYVVRNGAGKDWTPNDPNYTAPGQYFHTKSKTNLAWDITKGSPTIVVGVADDGLGYNHPDLSANVWANPGETPGDGIDNDGNGYTDDVRGWDFNANDNNPLPSGSDSHGTHVGGIIAARSNNSVGVAGTAGGDGSNADSGARLAGLRWDGPNGWTTAMVAEAYTYAANNGVRIVNASYNFDFWVSGGVPNPAVNAALTYAYDKGVLLMNSAGNNGALGAPRGVFTQPLFVASLNSADVRSGFSNYGSFVDIAAHGDGILSTTTNADGTGVNYEVYSGTSMSTPHAAGVAALIWSQNPTWTRDQVAARMLATADNVDGIAGNQPGTLGSGRVNAFRGLTATIAPPVFTNFRVNGTATTFDSVSVTVPRRLDPASVVASNFELVSDGADNVFGTPDDVAIPLEINGGEPYRMGTNELLLTPAGGGQLSLDRYRLTGLSGAARLRDPFGTPLDGDGNGTGGDNFVAVFGANPQISGVVYEDWNGDGTRDANDPGIAGRTVYLDTNNNGRLDGPRTFTTTTPVTIYDNATVVSDLYVSGMTEAVIDVNVKLNITHTWDADLSVFLLAPNGRRIQLFSGVGGNGNNFTNTVLDDEAGTPITAGSAPFTGTFRPRGSLGVVDGSSANGNWTLEVTDSASADEGKLLGWELTFASSVNEPTAVTAANGSYAFTGVPNGTYPVRRVLPAGWTDTGPQTYPLTISGPGTTYAGLDFGSGKNGRVYGFVFNDTDRDGVQDPGEGPLAGRTLFLDTNTDGDLDGGLSTVSSGTISVAITDNTTVTSPITVSGINGSITDLDVRLNITHTWDSDLDVFLIAPDGTRFELFTAVGGSSDDFTNTVLDDEAALSITEGTAPFTGSFRPEGSLADVDGLDANGIWTLEITDTATQDTGTLTEWALLFTAGEPFTTTDALGNAFFDPPAGSHHLRLNPLAGWSFTVPADGKHVVTVGGAPVFERAFGTRSAD